MEDISFAYFKVPAITSAVSYFSSVLLYPFEVCSTVIKADVKKIKLQQAARSIYKEGGYRSFYKGLNTVFYEVFPPTLIYFATYDIINNKLSKVFGKKHKNKKWVIPVFSSFLAETASLAIYVPINMVQTRIQTGRKNYQYESSYSALRAIAKEEGFLRLYLASPLLMIYMLGFTTIQFSLYEWLKKGILSYKEKKEFGIRDSLVATFFATMVASGVTNPIDTLVTRYQCTNFSAKGNKELTVFKLIKRDYKLYGFAGINRGFLIKMAIDIYYSSFYIPVYEHLRQKYGIELDI